MNNVIISFKFHLAEIFFSFSLFRLVHFHLIRFGQSYTVMKLNEVMVCERESKHNNKMKHEFYDINGRTIEQFMYPAVTDSWGWWIEG